MGGFETYLLQKSFKLNPSPFPGQYVDIIHISMLYWPEERGEPIKISQKTREEVPRETLPPVRVEGRPHGNHLERGGMKVSGI
ncbi:TPA: hypothetical protein DCX15_02110 [bacterium]|nr:hypothetical protein [bacterium]